MLPVAFLCVLLAQEQTPNPGRQLKALHGTWILVKAEFDGKNVPQREIEGTRFIIENGNLSMIEHGEKSEVGVVMLASDKDPGWFDVKVTHGVNRGKTAPGIFQIVGNRLTLCCRQPSRDRPVAFSSEMETSLLYLRRE